MTKKITVSLGNLSKLSAYLKDYEKKLDSKVTELIREMADNGVQIAQAKLYEYGAVNLGDLVGSIAMYVENGKAMIFTDSDHAAYVEFGTGVVGAYNPYPADLPSGWSYASGETIDPETGVWYFYNTNTGIHGYTQGMPSRPFMWDTANELRQKLTEYARGVFSANG